MKFINAFMRLFEKPSALTLAERQLAEYKRRLLEEEASASFHAKMVEYYVAGIERLTKHTTPM